VNSRPSARACPAKALFKHSPTGLPSTSSSYRIFIGAARRVSVPLVVQSTLIRSSQLDTYLFVTVLRDSTVPLIARICVLIGG